MATLQLNDIKACYCLYLKGAMLPSLGRREWGPTSGLVLIWRIHYFILMARYFCVTHLAIEMWLMSLQESKGG